MAALFASIIGGIFTGIINNIVNAFSNLNFKDIFAKISGFFKRFWILLTSDLFKKDIDIKGIMDNVISKIKDIFGNISDFFSNVNINDVFNKIKEFFTGLWDSISSWASGKGINLEPIKEKLLKFADIINPKPVDNRTGEEIAADIIRRAGIEVI